MTKAIFNSVQEVSMRLILLLGAFGEPLDAESLFAFDFIATYGKEFGLMDASLNGDDEFTMAKATLRRKRVMESIRFLVRNGFAFPGKKGNGTQFHLTEKGKSSFLRISNGSYAEKYQLMVNLGKKGLFYSKENPLDLILSKVKGGPRRG